MRNISRTTLRELKKRYLNVLKKCFLANLGIILLSAPSIAEEIVFDEVYDSITKEGAGFQGAFFRNKAEFGSVKFTNNSVTAENNLQGAFAIAWGVNSTFKGEVLVENNNFTLGTYGGSFISSDRGGEFIFEKKVEFINNHTITTNSGFATGSILDGSAHFKETALFQNNTVNKGNAGVIYNQKVGLINEDGTIEKYGITFDKTAIFLGNASISGSGGAIYNGNVYSGTILFQDDAYFGVQYNEDGTKTILGNEAVNGGAIYSVNGYQNQNGAIYNQYSTIDFKKKTEFVSNKATTAGGAIYNKSGSVVFEDHDENSETPAVPNITYGMTFKGDTLFTGNKAESETGRAYGGAISNNGYMLLAGENTFGGYLQDTEDADGDGDKTEYVLDSEGNKISLGNQAKQGGAIYNSGGKKEGDVIAYGMTLGKSTFMGNTALSQGGAIYNTGYMNFTDEALFEGNKASSQGGAIYNQNGIIDFNKKAEFVNNEVQNGSGGAISNSGYMNFASADFIGNKTNLDSSDAQGVLINSGYVIFKGYVLIKDNITTSGGRTFGGTVWNSDTALESSGKGIYFKGHTDFIGNKATANRTTYGGAISSNGTIEFNSVNFEGNQAISDTDVVFGGAIRNHGEMNFNGYAKFTENIANGYGGGYGGAVYNSKTMNFYSGFEFVGNKQIKNGIESLVDIRNDGTINFSQGSGDIGFISGGIVNLGTINKTGAGTLILGDAMVNSGGGTFTQSAGLTIAHTDHFLTGTNTISGGELRVHGADTNKLKATVSNGAMLTYLTTRTERQNVALGTNVSVIGANVTFGAYEGVEQAQYTLGSDIASDARALKVIIQDSNIKMTGDTYAGSYEIGSSNVIEMRDESIEEQSVTFADLDGSGATLGIDIALLKDSEGKTQLTADRLNLTSDGEGYKFAGVSFNTPMDGQALLDEILSGLMVGQDGTITPSIKHTVQVLGGNASFMGRKEATLSTASPYVYEVATAGQDLTVSADVLKGSALEYLNDTDTGVTLQIAEKGSTDHTVTEDLGEMGCGKKQILGSTSVATESVINASGKDLFTLGKADTELEMKDLTITGAGTAINNQAGKVTLENVVIKDTVGDTALKNGATLTLKDVSVDKGVVNSGKLTMSGNNALATLTNNGETMVEGGKLSVTTLGGAGTLTMNGAKLDATTISTDNKIVSNGMTVSDRLSTLGVKSLEVKEGTTLDLNLANVTAEKVENAGKLIANKDLSVGALEGTGTLTMNGAILDVADKFATSNKVVSNNMVIGENVTSEIHFADLEIKDNTTLDIKTLQATANTVTVGENATLGITLKNLDEYGTMKADEIIAKEDSKVHLTLGDNFAGGVFDVFKGTKGSGDLELVHNNVYNVVEVSEGKYSFMAKDTESLQESLGTTDNETVIANALTQGTTGHAVFSRMQSEMLVALQSQNKETVAKAKKALNALGARSTSVYQSQATAQFTQMHTVITQMLMNSTAPIFGHAGGEEPARATVYVKGLYDRVNSLAGDGFRMRSKGAVLGVQSAITEDLTVGIGYAGINSVAKEPLRRTEVDTSTGFISAQYQPNNWWVNGVVTYSRSQYDEEKNILSTKGIAKYDVDSLGAQITTGYNIKRGNWIVTPEVGVRYLNARQEGYVDSLGTTVEKTTSDFVTTMAGFKVGVDLGWMRPLAGVMVGYDVVTDDVSAVNTLANKETYIIKGEALDRLSTTVVAGFAADIGDNATLKLEYSGNYRKEYLDHSGMLRLELRF